MRPHLASLVDDFRRHPGEIAVVAHRGVRRHPTTYGALAELAGRFAAALDLRAIAPGDRVVLWGQNSAEWIAAFFGCMLRGVIAVPLDATGSAEFALRVIAEVAPRLIIGDAALLRSIAGNVAAQPPHLAFADLQAHLPRHPSFAISDAVTQQTPFQIVFTSGTTSEPRGIVHTHRNVLVTLEPIEREIAKYRRYERIVHPLRFLHSLPLSHVFGQFMGLWIPAILAAELHFTEQLEAARLANLIRRERISVLIAVPRIQQLLRAHLLMRFPTLTVEIDRSAGLSIYRRWLRFRRIHSALGWKFWAVISGGATLPPDLETFWNRLGFALIQGYGMTETAALVTLNHPFHIRQGSIGKPLPGREVKIADTGEILVRGDMLASATWQSGSMHPRQGEWLATGDLAEQRTSGDLRFLGRKGDIIVTSAGLNIHPADLEAAITAQPGIRACVVVPCELAIGPEPVAVVLFSGPEALLQTAVSQANRTLAEYQQIRRVLRWPELQFPYTSTGKLIRRHVAQWACDTLLHRNQPAELSGASAAPDVLLKLISEITNEPARASADADSLRLSEDLHLDSLALVQLQTSIEQHFGLELSDNDISSVAHLANLRQLVNACLELQQETSAAVDQPRTLRSATTQPPTDTLQPPTDNQTYPRWPWSPPIHALRIAFLELIMRPLVWLLAAPRVSLPPQPLPSEPFLIVANHVTAYDGALILCALPPHLRRRVAVAMSGEMLLDLRHGRNQSNPLLKLLAPIGYWLITALFNVFPLPRSRGFRASFSHAGEAMDRAYSVLIFPEGTRSRTGNLNPFRSGIGLLAEQSRVPILPVVLIGLGELRAPGSRWFRSGRLEVRIGHPIQPPSGSANPAETAAQLEQAVRDLLPQ